MGVFLGDFARTLYSTVSVSRSNISGGINSYTLGWRYLTLLDPSGLVVIRYRRLCLFIGLISIGCYQSRLIFGLFFLIVCNIK